MGVKVFRAEHEDDVVDTVAGAASFAFDGDLAAAVLLSQRMIGAKDWNK